jgi:hypothetical protein
MTMWKPPRSWGGLERIPKTTLSSADTSMQTNINLRPSRSHHAPWCKRPLVQEIRHECSACVGKASAIVMRAGLPGSQSGGQSD